MRISDWSSDVCSSDLSIEPIGGRSARTRVSTDSTSRTAPIVNSATPATRCATPTERKKPYGYSGVAGFAMTRIETRSEEHTSELQSLMRISYAVFCLKKKKNKTNQTPPIRDHK